MNIYHLIRLKSKNLYLFVILLGLFSGLINIGILVFLNGAIRNTALASEPSYRGIGYVIMVAASFGVSFLFQKYMVDMTNDILYEMELSIIQKIKNASFQDFEKLGTEKLYASISDARFLSRVPEVFVTLINASITVLCCLIYLFYISPWGAFTVIVLMGALLLFYLVMNRKITRDLNIVRDLQNEYYRSVKELLAGFRQVRISSKRNKNLYNKFILSNRNKARKYSVSVSRRYMLNGLVGVYSWYVLLGVVMFLLPLLFRFHMIQMASFLTTILFMISPISQLINFFPFQTAVKISLERINLISEQLKSYDGERPALRQFHSAPFVSVRFEDVRFDYFDQNDVSFRLSVPDVTIKQGEIVFLTGGNGSGKSTFINILTGLYKPAAGKIYLNGDEIDWGEYISFSNQMAVVFTNHHLFGDNYDEHDFTSNESLFEYYREMLNLSEILKLDPARNFVDTDLSKGQQKRLALLLALMEDKPLIILDEWAAEQDPVNRKYFYTKWLTAMKDMGKTVIAITHDDDYFHTADRVIRFDYGRITSDGVLVN